MRPVDSGDPPPADQEVEIRRTSKVSGTFCVDSIALPQYLEERR
jgi:hypothetical protein